MDTIQKALLVFVAIVVLVHAAINYKQADEIAGLKEKVAALMEAANE